MRVKGKDSRGISSHNAAGDRESHGSPTASFLKWPVWALSSHLRSAPVVPLPRNRAEDRVGGVNRTQAINHQMDLCTGDLP